jgi:hypothetical protein
VPHDEAYGPEGDASRHVPLHRLEEGLRGLRAPADAGRLALIVSRRADGVRETPPRIRLTPEGGVPGDRWGRLKPDVPGMQLAVMRRDVAELIAGGQPLTTFGDNLFVDLDLSTANLPPGSRLRLGEAVVEVTPEPHDGCRKFRSRFGADALRFVAQAPTRDCNLRGVYWTTVSAGAVAAGDGIEVLSRAPR